MAFTVRWECEGPDLGCPVQVTTDWARLRCEAPQDSNHITHSTSHIGNKTIAWPQTVIITIYLDYLCKYFVTPKQIVVDLTNIICLSTLSYCSCEVELKVLYISCVTVSFGPDHFIIVNWFNKRWIGLIDALKTNTCPKLPNWSCWNSNLQQNNNAVKLNVRKTIV